MLKDHPIIFLFTNAIISHSTELHRTFSLKQNLMHPEKLQDFSSWKTMWLSVQKLNSFSLHHSFLNSCKTFRLVQRTLFCSLQCVNIWADLHYQIHPSHTFSVKREDFVIWSCPVSFKAVSIQVNWEQFQLQRSQNPACLSLDHWRGLNHVFWCPWSCHSSWWINPVHVGFVRCPNSGVDLEHPFVDCPTVEDYFF